MKNSSITFVFYKSEGFNARWTCFTFTRSLNPDSNDSSGTGDCPSSALENWLSTNKSFDFDCVAKFSTDDDEGSKPFTFKFEQGDIGASKPGFTCWEECADGAIDSNYYGGTGYTKHEALANWLGSEMDNLNNVIDPLEDDLPQVPDNKESQISVICLAAMELANEAVSAGNSHRVDNIKAHALDRVMDVVLSEENAEQTA